MSGDSLRDAMATTVRVAEGAITVIERERDLVRAISEAYGALVADLMDITERPEDFDLDDYRDEAQRWLLSLKQLEGLTAEMLDSLRDLLVLKQVLGDDKDAGVP